MNFLKVFGKTHGLMHKAFILDIIYLVSKRYSLSEIIIEYAIYRPLHDFEN